MGLKMSPALRSDRADQIKRRIAGGTLELRAGDQVADTQTGDPSLVLCVIDIPEDCLNAAVNGQVTIKNVWVGIGKPVAGAGTAVGHFRIKSKTGQPEMDGTVSAVDGGGNLIINAPDNKIASNQSVRVLSFNYTDGNQ